MKSSEKKPLELTVDNVVRIFMDCLFKDEEIKEGRPICEFTITNGIMKNVVFNTARINQYKTQIAELVGMLPRIDAAESFLNLCNDKNGNQWADLHQTMEQLVQLGIASEILAYFPVDDRKVWASFPGGMPFIIRNKEKLTTLVIGKDPSEFPVQKENKKVELEKVRKEAEFLEKVRLLVIENFKNNYIKAQPIFKMLGFEAKLENEEIVVYDLEGKLVGTMIKDWTMGGTTLEIETEKGKLEYIVCVDGKCDNDKGNISRNIIKLCNIKQINSDEKNKKFEGRYIGIELGLGEIASSDIPRIEIKVIDPNAENIITEFETNSYSFHAKLENAFGPWGNYIDGTSRSINYNDITKSPYRGCLYFMNFEKVCNGESHYLILRPNYHDELNPNGITFETSDFIDNEKGIHEFSRNVERFEVPEITYQLLALPRTKKLVDYILNSINNTLPGIKEYIMNKSDFMVEVDQIMNNHIAFSEVESLSEGCRVSQCDLPEEIEEYKIDTSEYQTTDGDHHLSIEIIYKDKTKKIIEGPIMHSPNDVGATGYWISDGKYIFIVFTENNKLESVFDIEKRCKLKDREKAERLWSESLAKLSNGIEPKNRSPYVLGHLPSFKK